MLYTWLLRMLWAFKFTVIWVNLFFIQWPLNVCSSILNTSNIIIKCVHLILNGTKSMYELPIVHIFGAWSSIVRDLPNMYRVLGSISSNTHKKKDKHLDGCLKLPGRSRKPYLFIFTSISEKFILYFCSGPKKAWCNYSHIGACCLLQPWSVFPGHSHSYLTQE